jgi:hypothetical protein
MPRIVKNLETGQVHMDFELDPKELAAIGRVTVQWGYLENGIYAVSFALCRDAGVPLPEGAESLSLKTRLRTFREIVEAHVAEPEKKQLLRLHSKIARLQNERHKLSHGLWEWDRDDPSRVRASSFRPRVEFDQGFDVEKLYKLGPEIGEISFELEYPEGYETAFAEAMRNGGGFMSRDGIRAITGTLPEDHWLSMQMKSQSTE